MTTTGRLRGTVPGPATPLGHHPYATAASQQNRERPLHPTTHARVVRELVVHRRAELLLGHAPRQLRQLAERRALPRGVLLEFFLRAVGLVEDAPVWKSNFTARSAGSSPLDGASTAASSP